MFVIHIGRTVKGLQLLGTEINCIFLSIFVDTEGTVVV